MFKEQILGEAAQRPTPFYAYDLPLLERTVQAAREAASSANYVVHYALKACTDPKVLAIMARAGFGADCVSGGEVAAAAAAGFVPDHILFAGVGKTDAEIELALRIGIGAFNVESAEELEVIASIAERMGVVAPVALRVNPNVDAHTHAHITTGLAENKFGINREMLMPIARRAVELPSLRFIGLHFHIGSQLLDMAPYAELCSRINEIQNEFDAAGIELATINVGGGLGIDYDDPDGHPVPDFKSYFDTFRNNLRLRPGQTLHFELGRSLVAQCGSLIAHCTYVKHGVAKKFVILDAGMAELIRPALYGAHHRIQNLSAPDASETETYDVVGPVCESSDTFAKDERLPLTHRGDVFALRSAGAYGEVMSSGYNCRKLNPTFYIQ